MTDLLHAHPVRRLVTRSPRYEVWVDRVRALYGSWYEFFPRSEGPVVDGVPTHGTFADAASGCRRSRRWSSTSSTCHRSTRSAR